MSRFVTRLILGAADERDDGKWDVMQDLVYQSDVAGMTFTVPAGFATDLNSCPRLPIVYLLTGGKANSASAVHDWIYTEKMVPRSMADAVLREASAVTFVPRYVRFLMFWGVRAFGWSHWK
ncbi:MAG: DUF1353 domain-containing protein [Janthinobacterium lividum]